MLRKQGLVFIQSAFRQSPNFLLLQIPLGLLLYALGGWSFVIYGVFVRAVLLWHSTWLINSATHASGYRTFCSADNSRNRGVGSTPHLWRRLAQ